MPPTSPGPSVDLNADVGEGAGGDSAAGAPGAAGGDRAAGDEVLLDLVTSASVACGVHGGDPGTMRRTVEAAARRGVVVGAHPSYPDREGFGRRPMDIAPAQVTTEVRHQVEALDSLARRCGTRVRYVKPHGALYHRMADDEECALAVADALRQVGDLVLLAPAGSRTLGLVASTGVRIATEAFADRAYRPDGRLAPRGAAGSVLTDPGEAVRQAVAIAVDHRVRAVDGTTIDLDASSICVHGDTPGAGMLARRVREALESAGVTLLPFVT